MAAYETEYSAGGSRGASSEQVVQSVTSVPEPASVDRDHRIQRYLITMGIRTACFLLAVVLEGPARWVAVAGAVLLPYFAVVLANATRPHRVGDDPPLDPHAGRRIGA